MYKYTMKCRELLEEFKSCIWIWATASTLPSELIISLIIRSIYESIIFEKYLSKNENKINDSEFYHWVYMRCHLYFYSRPFPQKITNLWSFIHLITTFRKNYFLPNFFLLNTSIHNYSLHFSNHPSYGIWKQLISLLLSFFIYLFRNFFTSFTVGYNCLKN